MIFRQFLAKPGHRPIEVMQVEALDAVDPVILPPAVRRAIGATAKQPMQNGEEHRPFQRKIIFARAGEVVGRQAPKEASANAPPTLMEPTVG